MIDAIDSFDVEMKTSATIAADNVSISGLDG